MNPSENMLQTTDKKQGNSGLGTNTDNSYYPPGERVKHAVVMCFDSVGME